MTRPRNFRCSRRQTMAFFAIAILLPALATSAFASGPVEKVIYSFQGGGDGQYPAAALVADKAGNLYGTTLYGGDGTSCNSGCGTIFELMPPAAPKGTWTKTILHNFQGGLSDGASPSAALVFDKVGNLYGVTSYGGSDEFCYDKLILPGCGTVFQLSPPATSGGAWTEKILHAFPANDDDGTIPTSNLVFDSAGNLYGTTEGLYDGTAGCEVYPGGCGTVFELSPPATPAGAWSETVLHKFNGYSGIDGGGPSGLIFDRRGFLYGITNTGGHGCCADGTVFKMERKQGIWSEQALYTFRIGSGAEFPSSLTLDNAGNLYGVAAGTGNSNVVFELTPPAPGEHWTEAILYTFSGGEDGNNPAGVSLDKAGNLYGTASEGGLKNSKTQNNGTIFELSPPAISGGAWTETTLHEFGGSTYNDGSGPIGGLTFSKGKLYGTTSQGGTADFGAVFSIVVVP